MIKKIVSLTVITGLLAIGAGQPAYSGFQFTAPINSTPSAGMQQTPNVLLPMQPAPVPQVTSQPLVQQPMATPQSLPTASPPMPLALPQAQTTAPSNLIAVGFGNDLPLMTALKQIIPNAYSYNLAPDVSVNQKISWSGGDQWQIVLANALRPTGMDFTVNGSNVQIQNSSTQQAIVPLPQPTPQITQGIMPTAQQVAPLQPAMTSPAPQNILPVVSNEETNTPMPMVQQSYSNDPNDQQWSARNGDSLKDVLENWSNLAGIGLFWSSDYDYPLKGDVNLTGNFETAAQTLLEGFQNAQPRPKGRLHPNLPHGPAVLVIETRQAIE